MKSWIIYLYEFPNGKKYVGKTCQKLSRRQHSDWSGYKRCTLLWNAIQKYGVDNIRIVILEQGLMENSEAEEKEKYYIALFRTNANRYRNPSYGYNLTDGGEGVSGIKYSESERARRTEQLKSAQRAYLDKGVPETAREKMRQAKLGKPGTPCTEEHKAKIGYKNSLAYISDEQRQRRSDSKKKKVIAIHKETGEKIVFNSVEEAADHFSVRSSAVTRWCNKTRNPSIPYIFDYLTHTTNND